MRRWAQVVTALVMAVGGAAGSAHAQAASSDRGYAAVTAGGTFGHASGGSVGVEAGYWLTEMFGVFVEGGHMSNAATSEVEDKSKVIAQALGLTATVKQPVNFGDIGVIGRFPMDRITPYVLLGIGGARVSNNVTFSGALSPQAQLGGDLSGHYNEMFITAGLGVRYEFGDRWFADASYRYGSVGKNQDSNLGRVNTNRLQVGAGVRF